MKLSEDQIVQFFNQAIENETGYKGKLTTNTVSWSNYEVMYKSESEVTLIKIYNTCIWNDDLQNENVTLGSVGDNYNFQFYY
jgi:hypothetical protein